MKKQAKKTKNEHPWVQKDVEMRKRDEIAKDGRHHCCFEKDPIGNVEDVTAASTLLSVVGAVKHKSLQKFLEVIADEWTRFKFYAREYDPRHGGLLSTAVSRLAVVRFFKKKPLLVLRFKFLIRSVTV